MSWSFCTECPLLPGEQHLTAAAAAPGAPALQTLPHFCRGAEQHHSTASFQGSGERAAQDCFEYFRNYFEGGCVKGEEIAQIREGKQLLFEQGGLQVIAGNRLQMNLLCKVPPSR